MPAMVVLVLGLLSLLSRRRFCGRGVVLGLALGNLGFLGRLGFLGSELVGLGLANLVDLLLNSGVEFVQLITRGRMDGPQPGIAGRMVAIVSSLVVRSMSTISGCLAFA